MVSAQLQFFILSTDINKWVCNISQDIFYKDFFPIM